MNVNVDIVSNSYIPGPVGKKLSRLEEDKKADLNRGEIYEAIRYANVTTEDGTLVSKRNLGPLLAEAGEITEEKDKGNAKPYVEPVQPNKTDKSSASSAAAPVIDDSSVTEEFEEEHD